MKRELPVLTALIVLLFIVVSVWPSATEDERPVAPPAQEEARPEPCPELEVVATRCKLRFLPGRVPLLLVEWRARVWPKPPSS